jgi:hypothetical protein
VTKFVNEKKSCFVISPIGKRGSETRKHTDQVFNHIISPIVKQLGFSPERSDHIEQTGKITDQIFERLLSADVVIADMSTHNPNVFYELAIRHVIKKPCLHLIMESDTIPFDVHGMRAIFFDLANPDSVQEAKESLERHLNNLDSKSSSPFGKEFEDQLDWNIMGRGSQHFARIAIDYPDALLEGLILPGRTSNFQVLEVDDVSLQLLKTKLEFAMYTLNVLIEKNARVEQAT